MEVNVHEAKTHFSRLLERAEHGEEVIIMRANVPVAKLSAIEKAAAKLELGWARGEFEVPKGFQRSAACRRRRCLLSLREDAFYR